MSRMKRQKMNAKTSNSKAKEESSTLNHFRTNPETSTKPPAKASSKKSSATDSSSAKQPSVTLLLAHSAHQKHMIYNWKNIKTIFRPVWLKRAPLSQLVNMTPPVKATADKRQSALKKNLAKPQDIRKKTTAGKGRKKAVVEAPMDTDDSDTFEGHKKAEVYG